MNKKLMAAAVMCSLMSTTAFAANPIPTFDKEAVTTHPYNRTGQQEQQVEGMQGAGELYKPGNTGTEAKSVVSSVMLRVIVSLTIILLMLLVLFNRTAAAVSCRI